MFKETIFGLVDACLEKETEGRRREQNKKIKDDEAKFRGE